MSKRLQVLLDEKELALFQRKARAGHQTLAEWVRQALRSASRREPTRSVEQKIASIKAAARHRFPAPSIDVMLDEIERGYLSGSGE